MLFCGCSCQSFEETHAGLYTLLTSVKNFANHVERKYRLKQYEQEGEFFMTANERWFHLIGFIDALIWSYRGNLLKNPDTLQQELADTYCSDKEPLDENDTADYKAALESMEKEHAMPGDCIICYECGENKQPLTELKKPVDRNLQSLCDTEYHVKGDCAVIILNP